MAASSSGNEMKVVKSEKDLTNRAYMRGEELEAFRSNYPFRIYYQGKKLYLALINGLLVVRLSEDNSLRKGEIALNEQHCDFAKTTMGGSATVNSFELPPDFEIVELYVGLESPNSESMEINAPDLEKKLKDMCSRQVMSVGQRVLFEYKGILLIFIVTRLFTDKKSPYTRQGLISGTTKILFDPSSKHIKIMKQDSVPTRMFWKEINLEIVEQELISLGIGGMDTIFTTIYDMVIAPRIHLTLKSHVKGILLYGPPGTGKTLLVRKLGELLHAKEPKVVNGPEILDRWTGGSEINVRKLFVEAKQDYKIYGDHSPLHIIIFDEIDSIAQTRGRNPADTGSDRVVNQLLTMIDGVNELNNILIVGTTNRKDLIDDALLRSGRLELHIEVGLPNEPSRLKILKVHNDKLAKDLVMLPPDINLEEIASRTTGRSGADLAAIVRAAVAHASNRARRNKEEKIKVSQDDYIYGVNVICPASEILVLQNLKKYRSDAIMKLDSFDRIINRLDQITKKIEQSKEHHLVTCLLSGPIGCGKTTLAAFIPRNNSFQHVDLVSPYSMIEFTEKEKVAKIVQVFEEARRFLSSFIILDDIEWLVEYNALERRCSSVILNTLLIQLKEPPKSTKILVVGTTSNKNALEEMGFCKVFSLNVDVPLLGPENSQKILKYFDVASSDELEKVEEELQNMSIKNLRMLIDMTSHGEIKEVLAGRRRLDISNFLMIVMNPKGATNCSN